MKIVNQNIVTMEKFKDWHSEFTKLPIYSPNGHYTVKEGEVGTPVCILLRPFGGNSKIQEARLKLIESAPELLEALQDFVEAVEDEDIVMYDNIDHDGFASTPNRLYTNAKKAINKALGK